MIHPPGTNFNTSQLFSAGVGRFFPNGTRAPNYTLTVQTLALDADEDIVQVWRVWNVLGQGPRGLVMAQRGWEEDRDGKCRGHSAGGGRGIRCARK